MIANKYSNFLTIVLIIVIIVILILLGILGYNAIKNSKVEKESAQAIAEFEQNIDNEDDNTVEENTNEIQEIEPAEQSSTRNGTGEKKVIKKTYYKEFVMIGYITIPKTNVKQPILDSPSPKAIETAVAVIYPSNPKLNQAGNVVIIGHNYRNGQFFSNNKKLSTGDKILIKDENGKELTYIIYEIFETTPEDTSFYNRNTNGAIEVTLSTCTDDGNARTIILAKVQ